MKRRRFLQLNMGALFAAGLSGCGQGQPLRIAIQPWCGYQFVKLASLQGWMSTETIQIMDTALAIESKQALQNGAVDCAALTLDEVLLLLDAGLDLKVALVFNVSAGADVLLVRPEIDRLQQLRGKRIGVENSSLGAIMLAEFLSSAGLQRSEVVVIDMDADHISFWDNENLDAVLTYDPSRSELVNRGLIPLFDSRSLPLTIVDVLAVRGEVLSDKAGAIRDLIAGHFYALRQWQENPINTSYQLAPLIGVGAEAVNDVYKGLDLPDALYNRRYLTPPAAELTRAATSVAGIMREAGMLGRMPELEGLFVADYLPGQTG
jgi:NitT/TauT family transport system substrate-binding protein